MSKAKATKPQPMISTAELLDLIRTKQNGLSYRNFAPEVGVSAQFLAKVMAGQVHPGPKLASAMGFEQVMGFRAIQAKPKAKRKAKAAKAAAGNS